MGWDSVSGFLIAFFPTFGLFTTLCTVIPAGKLRGGKSLPGCISHPAPQQLWRGSEGQSTAGSSCLGWEEFPRARSFDSWKPDLLYGLNAIGEVTMEKKEQFTECFPEASITAARDHGLC